MKLLLLAFLLSAPLAFAGDPISFRQLAADETIHVTFTSNGCFHSETFEFDFLQGPTVTAKVSHLDRSSKETKQARTGAKPVLLGTVELSKAEVAGLDRLLTFYRSKQLGGCTTVDRITVTQKRGETVIATESYTDGTCATYEMKDLTLLTSIAAKLSPKSK